MDLLTVDETARILKLNPVTVRRFIADGRLPAVRVGRRVRIHKEAVEALLKPVTPKEDATPKEYEPYRFTPPTPEEIARRKALFELVMSRREKRNIAPLTSVDLIREVREQEAQKYEKR